MTFKEFLAESGETPRHFAKRCFFAYNTIRKLYRGGSVRVDIAKRIQRATNKEVTLKDLGHGP